MAMLSTQTIKWVHDAAMKKALAMLSSAVSVLEGRRQRIVSWLFDSLSCFGN